MTQRQARKNYLEKKSASCLSLSSTVEAHCLHKDKKKQPHLQKGHYDLHIFEYNAMPSLFEFKKIKKQAQHARSFVQANQF